MQITFHGAAQCVTGSKHLITLDSGEQILLDCGMFQGMGKATLSLNKDWSFDAKKINCLILSHAHIDHSGLIPLLVKRGFKGRILCTPLTLELCKIMLLDSAHIQEEDVYFINKKNKKLGIPPIEPLYTKNDIESCIELFEAVPYLTPTKLSEHIQVTLYDAGHILGSASIFLELKEKNTNKTILFSGDIGKYKNKIITSPQETPQADVLIVESTYGNRSHYHPNATQEDSQLSHWIDKICMQQNGKLVIPAFSLGRTQELLYELNTLELKGVLPKIKYYVDSPLSMELTNLAAKYVNQLNWDVQQTVKKDPDKNPFLFEGLTYIKSPEESKTLRYIKEPFVVISSSGMGDAGRVKHHISNYVQNSMNAILMSGYAVPSSLCGKLLNAKKEVSIFGITHQVHASIGILSGMSAHGDHEDIMRYISHQHPSTLQHTLLVHGEEDGFDYLKNVLLQEGYQKVVAPELRESITL